MNIHMNTTTTVQKWGNSLGLRLPKSITERYAIRSGSVLTIIQDKTEIKIRPQREAVPTLEEMLAAITKKNRHKLIDFGPPVGKEIC